MGTEIDRSPEGTWRAIVAWVAGTLPPASEVELLELVHGDARVRAQYRKLLAVMARDPACKLDASFLPHRTYRPPAALSCFADPIVDLRLPHAGDDARLRVEHREDGSVEASWAGKTHRGHLDVLRLVVPLDETAGDLVVSWVVEEPSIPQLLELAAWGLEGGTLEETRAALGVFERAATDVLTAATEAGLDALDEAELEPEEALLVQQMACVLDVRARAQCAAPTWPRALVQELDGLDARLAAFADATWALHEDVYLEAIADGLEDAPRDAWWARRAKLTAVTFDTPTGAIDFEEAFAREVEAFSLAAAANEVEEASVGAAVPAPELSPWKDLVAAARRLVRELAKILTPAPALPSPALADAPASAAASSIIIPVVEPGGKGGLVRLEVGPLGREAGPAELGFDARLALRRAYYAAAELVERCGRRAPHLHGLDVRCVASDGQPVAVDMDSLQLGAAIAFLASWGGGGELSGVAATGALNGQAIANVAGETLAAKVRACAAGGVRQLLLPSAQTDAAGTAGAELKLLGVSSVAEALEVLGVDPCAAGEARTASARERLEHLIQCFVDQDTDPTPDAWMRLGVELRAASERYRATERHEPELVHSGLAKAALAFFYAGDDEGKRAWGEADAYLRSREGGDRAFAPTTEERAWTEMVRLSQLTYGEHHVDEARACDERLAAVLAELNPKELRDVGGRVQGNRGTWRALRFAELASSSSERLAVLAEAEALLTAGVAHHELHAPHEVPRSLQMLSMCQRRRCWLDPTPSARSQLVATLGRTFAALDRCWEDSEASRKSLLLTQAFAWQEAARALLDRALIDEGVAAEERAEYLALALEAIDTAERVEHGFQGLRDRIRATRAWLLRALGRHHEADAIAATITDKDLATSARAGYRDFIDGELRRRP